MEFHSPPQGGLRRKLSPEHQAQVEELVRQLIAARKNAANSNEAPLRIEKT